MHRTELAYITTTLKGAVALLSDDQRALARDCFEHHRSEAKRIAGESPLRIAYTIHELVDARVATMRRTSVHGKEVQCRKGCAHCCHLNVGIFPHEAALLLALAQEAGNEIDEARLQRQAAKDDDTWHELAPEDRRCVFLAEDRTCRVYEHRPNACRKYLVKTDPALCDMQKYPGGQVGIVFDIEAEIIHSAAMTVYGAGNMATMLLKASQGENKCQPPQKASSPSPPG